MNKSTSSEGVQKSMENVSSKKRQKYSFPPGRDDFPYAFGGANFLDHFETPALAYGDIAGVLNSVANALRVEPSKLRIYDPYFCRGSMKTYLAALGFTQVYNENEDFYESARYKDESLFDVVVTNPPYSGQHKERCMNWLRSLHKPWCCLMWNFAASKAWYHGGTSRKAAKDFYLQPVDKSRYDFRNPQNKGMQGGSPYVPLWFLNTTAVEVGNEGAIANSLEEIPGVQLVKHFDSLAKHGVVRGFKRLNPRQRKKKREQKKRMFSASSSFT